MFWERGACCQLWQTLRCGGERLEDVVYTGSTGSNAMVQAHFSFDRIDDNLWFAPLRESLLQSLQVVVVWILSQP